MEIKIFCDALVNIENFNGAYNVKCSIVDYKKEKDILNGNILITGEFFKDNLDERYPFSEVVPFSILFKNQNFKIESVVTRNFTFQELVNQGLEVNFEIVVKYNQFEEEDEKEEIIEIPIEIIASEEFEENDIEIPDEITEIEENLGQDLEIEEFDEDLEIPEELDELTKELINEKYDKLLKEVLDARTDNFFETESEKVSNVKILQGSPTRQNVLTMFDKEEYKVLKVRYIEKESDLEKISKKENISIDKIYKDNKNNKFIEQRRIIIK